jgi:hypothetical protein
MDEAGNDGNVVQLQIVVLARWPTVEVLSQPPPVSSASNVAVSVRADLDPALVAGFRFSRGAGGAAFPEACALPVDTPTAGSASPVAFSCAGLPSGRYRYLSRRE